MVYKINANIFISSNEQYFHYDGQCFESSDHMPLPSLENDPFKKGVIFGSPPTYPPSFDLNGENALAVPFSDKRGALKWPLRNLDFSERQNVS